MVPWRAFLELTLLAVSTAAVAGVQFSWGPSDLTATVKPGSDGYNTLEVSWSPGECGKVGLSAIEIVRDGVVQNQSVSTARGLAVFEGCEYWSEYEVILKAGIVCLEQELHTFIDTGPGPPHKPKAVMVTPHKTSAELAIVEAFMPREVSGYSLQLCRIDEVTGNECRPVTFINHTTSDGSQTATITDLIFESTYSYQVVPVIMDGTKNYRGFPVAGSFKTAKPEYPKVIDLTMAYEERNATLSTMVTWKMSNPDFLVKSFWITVEPCSSNCTHSTSVPEVSLSNLDFSSNIKLEITTMFIISDKLKIDTFSFNLTTPKYIEPIKSLEVAKMSPTEVIFAWAPSGLASEYDVKICTKLNCKTQKMTFHEIHIRDQEPGSPLDIGIEIIQGNLTAEYFKGRIEMLQKDYEAPDITSIDLKQKYREHAKYTVNASIGMNVTRFEVEACTAAINLRDCRRFYFTNIRELILSLNYFSSYDVEIIAVYELPLKQEVRKSSKTSLVTVGTDPDAVENIVASEITSDSLELSWVPPRNIPAPVEGSLMISYEISTESTNWTSIEPHLKITGLRAYTKYNFTVRAVVMYRGVKCIGKVARTGARTDASKPGKPQNLRVDQRHHSPVISVSWNPPAETERNGGLDFYVLEYGPVNQTRQRVRVNGTQTKIQLPVPQNDTIYEFSIAAGNDNWKHEELVGDSAKLNVTVPGIGLTFTVAVVQRGPNSVLLLFKSSDDAQWPKDNGRFYTITDSMNKTVKTGLKIFTFGGLKPYQKEVLRIRACYQEDFCTDEINFEILTDVGAPSAVSGLRAEVLNRTNLGIFWKDPAVKNGPVDGCVVQIIDETDAAVNLTFTVMNATQFYYNTTDEFETFRISLTPFNTLLDTPTKRLYGPTTVVRNETSGFSLPKVVDLRISDENDTTVSLAWEDQANANHTDISYEIRVSNSTKPKIVNQDHTATISGFRAFEEFSIEVRTCLHNTTEHSCSLPRRIYGRTEAAAPTAPQNLTVRILDDFTVYTEWEAPQLLNGRIDGYTLSIKNSSGNFVFYLNGTQRYYKINDVNPSETYQLSVVAYNYNTTHHRLDSPSATAQFWTGHHPVWIFVVAGLIVAFTVAVAGVLFVRKRRAVPYVHIDEEAES